MSELKCNKHGVDLECMSGCSAHRSNWCCPECDAEHEQKLAAMVAGPKSTDSRDALAKQILLEAVTWRDGMVSDDDFLNQVVNLCERFERSELSDVAFDGLIDAMIELVEDEMHEDLPVLIALAIWFFYGRFCRLVDMSADLFGEKPRRKKRVMMHVADAGNNGTCNVIKFHCNRCGKLTDWGKDERSISENKRGLPCLICNT